MSFLNRSLKDKSVVLQGLVGSEVHKLQGKNAQSYQKQ